MSETHFSNNIRISLCSIFAEEPILFKCEALPIMRRKSKVERLKCISRDIVHNTKSLD
jgi:hypothetical protein